MSIGLKTLGDKMVVKVVTKQEEKTAGGIYLPESAMAATQGDTKLAEVMAAGQGTDFPGVCVGDIVILSHYAGVPVKHDGQDLLVIAEKDILAIHDSQTLAVTAESGVDDETTPFVEINADFQLGQVKKVRAEITTKVTGSEWLTLKIENDSAFALMQQAPLNDIARDEAAAFQATLQDLELPSLAEAGLQPAGV